MYQLRDEDPEFAEAWDDALNEAMDVAEGEIYRRAVRGVVRKVFYKDQEIDQVREYSDTLLIFLAKAHRPEKYRETTNTKFEGTLKTNSTVTHAIDSNTATSIFDILAAAGVFESGASNTAPDEVHSASSDA